MDAIANLGNLQFLGIVDAYRKGIAYEFQGSVSNVSNEGERPEDFMIDISVDDSQKGPGEVIGFVSGHTHTDNLSQKVGYENSLSYGYSYLSLIGSDSFATMVVDWGDGYTSDGNTVLDSESLELVSAQENEKWAISKAIPVKQATQHVISDIGSRFWCIRHRMGVS